MSLFTQSSRAHISGYFKRALPHRRATHACGKRAAYVWTSDVNQGFGSERNRPCVSWASRFITRRASDSPAAGNNKLKSNSLKANSPVSLISGCYSPHREPQVQQQQEEEDDDDDDVRGRGSHPGRPSLQPVQTRVSVRWRLESDLQQKQHLRFYPSAGGGEEFTQDQGECLWRTAALLLHGRPCVCLLQQIETVSDDCKTEGSKSSRLFTLVSFITH